MMSDRTSLKWQWIASASGIGFVFFYTIFFGYFGHNLPPVSAALSANDLAAFYHANGSSILFGQTLAAFFGILWVPWTAQLTVVMLRIEGKSPVLTWIQLIGGILTAWVVVFCPSIWVTCAYRTDIDANTLRALNDLGYLMFNITYMGTTLQAVAVGIVGLADKSEHPLFPRWVSWVAILAGISFIPITLDPFFKSGPWSWNGSMNFWAWFATYFVWIVTMSWCMSADVWRKLKAA
jgi:hypothetical protein